MILPAQHHTVPLENLVNYKIKDNVIICANLNSDAAADNTAVAILHTFSKHLIKPMIQRKAQNDNAQSKDRTYSYLSVGVGRCTDNV